MLCLIIKLHNHSTIYFSILFCSFLFSTLLFFCIYLFIVSYIACMCLSCIVLFGLMTIRLNKYYYYYYYYYYYCCCCCCCCYYYWHNLGPPEVFEYEVLVSLIYCLCAVIKACLLWRPLQPLNKILSAYVRR